MSVCLFVSYTGSRWVFRAGKDIPARLLQQDKRFHRQSRENDTITQKYWRVWHYHIVECTKLISVWKLLFFMQISVIPDIADDYIHVSATLSSLSAEDSTANKKWVLKLFLYQDIFSVEGCKRRSSFGHILWTAINQCLGKSWLVMISYLYH